MVGMEKNKNQNAHPLRDGRKLPRYHPHSPHSRCTRSPTAGFTSAIGAPANTGAAFRTNKRRKLICAIHPDGSRGNFAQFPPGGGSSRCPPLPCRFCLSYFPLSRPLSVNCRDNYLQKQSSVKTHLRSPHHSPGARCDSLLVITFPLTSTTWASSSTAW